LASSFSSPYLQGQGGAITSQGPHTYEHGFAAGAAEGQAGYNTPRKSDNKN